MRVATPSEDIYRAAVEADLRESSESIEEGVSSTTFTLPPFPDGQPARVVLEADALNFEVQDQSGAWERRDRQTFEDAWSIIANRRIRLARKFLFSFWPWLLLAGIGAAGLWVFSPDSWISRAIVFGFVLGDYILFYLRVPTPEPFPGFFSAAFIFSMSMLARGLLPIDWALAGPAVGLVALSVWGFQHCGGPETIHYFRTHLSRDPRLTATD